MCCMRACRALLIFSLVAGSLPLQGQDSTAARLNVKEEQLEKLYADYWRAEYHIATGNEQLSSRSVQEKIRAVMTDEEFLQRLKAAHFHNNLLNRRRVLFLEEATYTKISNDPKLTAIVEEITRRENSQRYKIGRRELTRAELTEIVIHNPNRQLREEAWKAQAQISAAKDRKSVV